MAEPTQTTPPAADEKIVLQRRALEKLIKELFTARDKDWQVDLKPEYGLPKMLVMVIDKLLASIREILREKNVQLESLSHANMRALFLSEALTRLNEIDETGKQTEAAKSKLYSDALHEIMCAASSEIAILFFVDGRGLVTEHYCQGPCKGARSQQKDYSPMLGALTPAFAANDYKPVIFNDGDELLPSLALPAQFLTIRNVLAAPITFNNNRVVRGVLCFANKSDGSVFGENEIIVSELFLREIEHVRERMFLTRLLQREKTEQSRLLQEVKNTQEQLLQAEKMASIGQLAAGVAHEINNPVGYINSNISTLQNYITDIFSLIDQYQTLEEFLPDDKRQLIAGIRKKADLEFLSRDVNDLVNESIEGVTRVKQIVNDLKNFSRVDETAWALADLHQCIDSTLNIAQNEVKYKADIIRNYGNIPKVTCIAAQINQVILNLLVNAAHAIKERGTITITTGSLNEYVQISVADSGCGIPEENLKRIFDPFFTSKPVGVGTGLGLSLSYGIIEKHHGKIEVASEVGKGTVFTITLPVNKPEKNATSV